MYQGKVVLITGARRGVGHMVAEHFLKHGAQVVGFSRNDETGVPHPGYHPMAVDVGDAESVTRGFAVVRKAWGRVDIVVNNAAVLTSQYAMIMPTSAARSMLETNLFGTFLVSREAAKLMRRSKWGRIINVTSLSVKEPAESLILSNVFRTGVVAFAKSISKDLIKYNITINNLCPGAFMTDRAIELIKNAAKNSGRTPEEVEKENQQKWKRKNNLST